MKVEAYKKMRSPAHATQEPAASPGLTLVLSVGLWLIPLVLAVWYIIVPRAIRRSMLRRRWVTDSVRVSSCRWSPLRGTVTLRLTNVDLCAQAAAALNKYALGMLMPSTMNVVHADQVLLTVRLWGLLYCAFVPLAPLAADWAADLTGDTLEGNTSERPPPPKSRAVVLRVRAHGVRISHGVLEYRQWAVERARRDAIQSILASKALRLETLAQSCRALFTPRVDAHPSHAADPAATSSAGSLGRPERTPPSAGPPASTPRLHAVLRRVLAVLDRAMAALSVAWRWRGGWALQRLRRPLLACLMDAWLSTLISGIEISITSGSITLSSEGALLLDSQWTDVRVWPFFQKTAGVGRQLGALIEASAGEITLAPPFPSAPGSAADRAADNDPCEDGFRRDNDERRGGSSGESAAGYARVDARGSGRAGSIHVRDGGTGSGAERSSTQRRLPGAFSLLRKLFPSAAHASVAAAQAEALAGAQRAACARPCSHEACADGTVRIHQLRILAHKRTPAPPRPPQLAICVSAVEADAALQPQQLRTLGRLYRNYMGASAWMAALTRIVERGDHLSLPCALQTLPPTPLPTAPCPSGL